MDKPDFEHELRNLLAVMHGDGGHYTAEHGLLKSIKDAQGLLHTKWKSTSLNNEPSNSKKEDEVRIRESTSTVKETELIEELEAELEKIKPIPNLRNHIIGYASCISDLKMILKEKKSLPSVQVKSLSEYKENLKAELKGMAIVGIGRVAEKSKQEDIMGAISYNSALEDVLTLIDKI